MIVRCAVAIRVCASLCGISAMTSPPQIVVAGHVCLDIIPRFKTAATPSLGRLSPGALLEVGPATLATGGAVSNTGLALHRLGLPVRLMGKIGNDLFGDAIARIFAERGLGLADGLLRSRDEPTSYTVVINPPGIDRVFLHCPGVNDTFGADDVPYVEFAGTALFHFGYPPLMRRFYEHVDELERLLRGVKQHGAVTSLDMAMPDPASAAGRADWRAILRRALPYADVFLPSLDEIVYMLDPAGARLGGGAGSGIEVNRDLLSRVAAELLGMGTAVVGLKLGDEGCYVRTTSDTVRLEPLRALLRESWESWRGRELLAPCFAVEVAGTTGCGDCTIAGFLAGLARGLTLDDAATAAVATGACCAERPDATSGVMEWGALQERIARGWGRRV